MVRLKFSNGLFHLISQIRTRQVEAKRTSSAAPRPHWSTTLYLLPNLLFPFIVLQAIGHTCCPGQRSFGLTESGFTRWIEGP